ncbi:MAG: hypothetical protein WC477_06190 [Patescibacteria group bacterium]
MRIISIAFVVGIIAFGCSPIYLMIVRYNSKKREAKRWDIHAN